MHTFLVSAAAQGNGLSDSSFWLRTEKNLVLPECKGTNKSSRVCAYLLYPERRTLSFVSHFMLTPLVSFDMLLRGTKSRGDDIAGCLRGFDQDENIFKLT